MPELNPSVGIDPVPTKDDDGRYSDTSFIETLFIDSVIPLIWDDIDSRYCGRLRGVKTADDAGDGTSGTGKDNSSQVTRMTVAPLCVTINAYGVWPTLQ